MTIKENFGKYWLAGLIFSIIFGGNNHGFELFQCQ